MRRYSSRGQRGEKNLHTEKPKISDRHPVILWARGLSPMCQGPTILTSWHLYMDFILRIGPRIDRSHLSPITGDTYLCCSILQFHTYLFCGWLWDMPSGSIQSTPPLGWERTLSRALSLFYSKKKKKKKGVGYLQGCEASFVQAIFYDGMYICLAESQSPNLSLLLRGRR